jgi:hypothetical protein
MVAQMDAEGFKQLMLKVLVKSSVQSEAGAMRMNREYLSASLKG